MSRGTWSSANRKCWHVNSSVFLFFFWWSRGAPGSKRFCSVTEPQHVQQKRFPRRRVASRRAAFNCRFYYLRLLRAAEKQSLKQLLRRPSINLPNGSLQKFWFWVNLGPTVRGEHGLDGFCVPVGLKRDSNLKAAGPRGKPRPLNPQRHKGWNVDGPVNLDLCPLSEARYVEPSPTPSLQSLVKIPLGLGGDGPPVFGWGLGSSRQFCTQHTENLKDANRITSSA